LASSSFGRVQQSARYHASVWINHNASEVFCISADEKPKAAVILHTSLQSLHHSVHFDGSEHPGPTASILHALPPR
jgi:hypothetical protein